MNVLFVAFGGAVGAAGRYMISLIPYKGTFPLLTLITNLAGAFLIGIIVGFASKKDLPEHWILFLKTGLCGGFTTFSTFSLEAHNLIQAGHIVMAVVYMVLSVVLCLFGVFGGLCLAER